MQRIGVLRRSCQNFAVGSLRIVEPAGAMLVEGRGQLIGGLIHGMAVSVMKADNRPRFCILSVGEEAGSSVRTFDTGRTDEHLG